MICAGSGKVLGGWKDEYADETVRVRCTDCWRQVDAEPIEPETRTDLRIDGTAVRVNRKQIAEHERGGEFGVRWRRDRVGWLSLFAIVWTIGVWLYGMGWVLFHE